MPARNVHLCSDGKPRCQRRKIVGRRISRSASEFFACCSPRCPACGGDCARRELSLVSHPRRRYDYVDTKVDDHRGNPPTNAVWGWDAPENRHVADTRREEPRASAGILRAARQGDEFSSRSSAEVVGEGCCQKYPAAIPATRRPACFSCSGRWALGCGTMCRRARRWRQPIEGAAREDSEGWRVVRTNRACVS